MQDAFNAAAVFAWVCAIGTGLLLVRRKDGAAVLEGTAAPAAAG